MIIKLKMNIIKIKKMKCIISDDDESARLLVKHLAFKIEDLSVVGEFDNAIDGIKFLNEESVDLVFLDIHMPNFTGFDFIKTLNNPPNIILTTSDRDFAIDAFEYACVVDYILKPVTIERLQKAVDKVVVLSNENKTAPVQSLNAPLKEMYVNVDKKLVKINIPEIYLIEAKGDYIHIKTEGDNYIVHSSLKKIEEKLAENYFLRVHRSYLINIHKIIDIQDNTVLINRDVIPVSRKNKSELMKRLNLL